MWMEFCNSLYCCAPCARVQEVNTVMATEKCQYVCAGVEKPAAQQPAPQRMRRP
jgi:hypothetical protein